MPELKKLKKDEAEIFVRLNDKIVSVTLPPPLVNRLIEMQDDMNADDILEVLVKSAETMITTMYNLKSGKHITDRNGESVEVCAIIVQNVLDCARLKVCAKPTKTALHNN